jgi:hypothetical protein
MNGTQFFICENFTENRLLYGTKIFSAQLPTCSHNISTFTLPDHGGKIIGYKNILETQNLVHWSRKKIQVKVGIQWDQIDLGPYS